jgi:hypothetical protein
MPGPPACGRAFPADDRGGPACLAPGNAHGRSRSGRADLLAGTGHLWCPRAGSSMSVRGQSCQRRPNNDPVS